MGAVGMTRIYEDGHLVEYSVPADMVCPFGHEWTGRMVWSYGASFLEPMECPECGEPADYYEDATKRLKDMKGDYEYERSKERE